MEEGELITIPHFISPYLFWFHKVDGQNPAIHELQGIEDSLKALYSERRSLSLTPHRAIIGETVAISFVPWKKYIRGRVEHIFEFNKQENEYVLWAIDYGFPFQTKVCHIRRLPEIYKMQINHIRLGGITDIVPAERDFDFVTMLNRTVMKSAWSPRACEHLEKIINDAASISFISSHIINRDQQVQSFGDLKIISHAGKEFYASEYLIKYNYAIKDGDVFNTKLKSLQTKPIKSWQKNTRNDKLIENKINAISLRYTHHNPLSTGSSCDSISAEKVMDWCKRNENNDYKIKDAVVVAESEADTSEICFSDSVSMSNYNIVGCGGTSHEKRGITYADKVLPPPPNNDIFEICGDKNKQATGKRPLLVTQSQRIEYILELRKKHLNPKQKNADSVDKAEKVEIRSCSEKKVIMNSMRHEMDVQKPLQTECNFTLPNKGSNGSAKISPTKSERLTYLQNIRQKRSQQKIVKLQNEGELEAAKHSEYTADGTFSGQNKKLLQHEIDIEYPNSRTSTPKELTTIKQQSSTTSLDFYFPGSGKNMKNSEKPPTLSEGRNLKTSETISGKKLAPGKFNRKEENPLLEMNLIPAGLNIQRLVERKTNSRFSEISASRNRYEYGSTSSPNLTKQTSFTNSTPNKIGMYDSKRESQDTLSKKKILTVDYNSSLENSFLNNDSKSPLMKEKALQYDDDPWFSDVKPSSSVRLSSHRTTLRSSEVENSSKSVSYSEYRNNSKQESAGNSSAKNITTVDYHPSKSPIMQRQQFGPSYNRRIPSYPQGEKSPNYDDVNSDESCEDDPEKEWAHASFRKNMSRDKEDISPDDSFSSSNSKYLVMKKQSQGSGTTRSTGTNQSPLATLNPKRITSRTLEGEKSQKNGESNNVKVDTVDKITEWAFNFLNKNRSSHNDDTSRDSSHASSDTKPLTVKNNRDDVNIRNETSHRESSITQIIRFPALKQSGKPIREGTDNLEDRHIDSNESSPSSSNKADNEVNKRTSGKMDTNSKCFSKTANVLTPAMERNRTSSDSSTSSAPKEIGEAVESSDDNLSPKSTEALPETAEILESANKRHSESSYSSNSSTGKEIGEAIKNANLGAKSTEDLPKLATERSHMTSGSSTSSFPKEFDEVITKSDDSSNADSIEDLPRTENILKLKTKRHWASSNSSTSSISKEINEVIAISNESLSANSIEDIPKTENILKPDSQKYGVSSGSQTSFIPKKIGEVIKSSGDNLIAKSSEDLPKLTTEKHRASSGSSTSSMPREIGEMIKNSNDNLSQNSTEDLPKAENILKIGSQRPRASSGSSTSSVPKKIGEVIKTSNIKLKTNSTEGLTKSTTKRHRVSSSSSTSSIPKEMGEVIKNSNEGLSGKPTDDLSKKLSILKHAIERDSLSSSSPTPKKVAKIAKGDSIAKSTKASPNIPRNLQNSGKNHIEPNDSANPSIEKEDDGVGNTANGKVNTKSILSPDSETKRYRMSSGSSTPSIPQRSSSNSLSSSASKDIGNVLKRSNDSFSAISTDDSLKSENIDKHASKRHSVSSGSSTTPMPKEINEIVKTIRSDSTETSPKPGRSLPHSTKRHSMSSDSSSSPITKKDVKENEKINSNLNTKSLESPTKSVDISDGQLSEENDLLNMSDGKFQVQEFVKQLPEISNEATLTTNFIKHLLLAHSDVTVSPIGNVFSALFCPEIHEEMVNMRLTKLYRIQSYGWAHLVRGNSFFVINGPRTGKTLSYIPPLCSMINYRLETNCIPKGCGPIAVIIAPYSQKVEYITRCCNRILYGCTQQFKAVQSYAYRNALEVQIELHNGCGILVTTPPSLKRLLDINKDEVLFNIHRIQCAVIDGFDAMSNDYANFHNILQEFLIPIVQNKVKNKEAFQLVVASEKWSPYLRKLIKISCQPLLCIADYLEAAVYGKAKLSIKLQSKMDKLETITKYLENCPYALERVAILCSSDEEVEQIESHLSKTGYACITYTSLTPIEVRNSVNEWRKKESSDQILITTDSVLPELTIQNVWHLIHYSLSSTWTKFNFRFSVFLENYENQIKPGFSKDTSTKVPQSVILLDEHNNMQLPRLVEFMKHHDQLKHIPACILNIVEKVKNDSEEKRLAEGIPLCYKFIEFGSCQETSRCIYRHQLTKSDVAEVDFPTEGELRLKILEVFTPTHYAARLLTHRKKPDETWQVLRRSDEVSGFLMRFSFHFTDPNNHIMHYPIKTNDICVYRNNSNYHRCRILNTDDESSIRIKLIDSGPIVSCHSGDLFLLPDKFKTFPYQAIDIHLIGIVPHDNERVWDNRSKNSVKKWILTDVTQKDCLQANIDFVLRDIIWVNNLTLMEKLSGIKGYSIKLNVHRTLVAKHCGVSDDRVHVVKSTAASLGLISAPKNQRPIIYEQNHPKETANGEIDAEKSIDNQENVNTPSSSPTTSNVASPKTNEPSNSTTNNLNVSSFSFPTKNSPEPMTVQTRQLAKPSRQVAKPSIKEEWQVLSLDEMYTVKMYEFNDPNKFYVYIIKDDDRLEELEALIELCNKTPNTNPFPMQNCLVLYNKRYHRAKIQRVLITSIEEPVTARVFLCDIGLFINVPIDKILNTHDDIVQCIPFQAIRCKLIGLQKPSVGDKVTKLVHGSREKYQAYVVMPDEDAYYYNDGFAINSYKIVLYSCSGKTDIQINRLLITEGFAEYDEDTKHFLELDRNLNFEDMEYECGADELLTFQSILDDFMKKQVKEENEDKEANEIRRAQEKALNNNGDCLKIVEIDDKPYLEPNSEPESIKLPRHEKQDATGVPRLTSPYKQPLTNWYETFTMIYLKIRAPDIATYHLKVTSRSLLFTSTINDEANVLILNFWSHIDPEMVAHEIRGLNVVVCLVKEVFMYWPRLLESPDKLPGLVNDSYDEKNLYMHDVIGARNRKIDHLEHIPDGYETDEDEASDCETYTPIVNPDDFFDPLTDIS